MSEIKISETVRVVEVPIELIDKNDYNPNKLDDTNFNRLVQDMDELGFLQPILLVPKGVGRYRIIDGEHRYEAAKLSDMPTVPAVIVEGGFAEDEDRQKFQTMRMNMIRGSLDKRKFQAMVGDLLENHGLEAVAEGMAFDDVDALRAMIDNARGTLPTPEMRKEFDKAKEEIKTVDDLSNVLNRLFTRYGSTLPYHFMVMDFGGKNHLWVRLPHKKAYEAVTMVAQKCQELGVTFSSVLMELLMEHSPTVLTEGLDKLEKAEEE